MKRSLTFFGLGLLILLSCKKPAFENVDGQPIIGKWNYYQSYAGNGAANIYTSTENLRQWIEFHDDGTLASNMPEFKNTIHYQLYDSVKVKFTTAPPIAESHYFITRNPSAHTLTLSSSDFICIEGCGNIFRR